MAGLCRCPSEDDSIREEGPNRNADDDSTVLSMTLKDDEESHKVPFPDATPTQTPEKLSAIDGQNMLPAAAKDLGFVPQKRPFWNPLLPYSDSLDKESNRWLSEIKSGLGRAIVLQELRPAFSWEVESLNKYMNTYQKKFSKDDHVYFIKICYNALNQAKLEPSIISQLCDILNSLLDEPKLLSPQVLQLPWRPLYDSVERIAYNKEEEKGLWRIGGSKIKTKIWSVVPIVRPYFGVEATKEMLAEWRPWLCPFDGVVFNKAMKYLHNFLPTKLPPSSQASGFKLWFDEMMSMWLHSTGGNIYCGNGIEAYLNSLFSRLAEENIGYIDWEPYLPELFNRFFRALRLPAIPSVTPASFPVVTMSRWLIASLRPAAAAGNASLTTEKNAENVASPVQMRCEGAAGPNDSANNEGITPSLDNEASENGNQTPGDDGDSDGDEDDFLSYGYSGNENNSNADDAATTKTTTAMTNETTTTMTSLRHLFSVADSYFHPSNHGSWTEGLLQLMRALTDHLSQRLWRERVEKPSWFTPIPESWKLSDQDVHHLCDAILPVAWKAMYSKAGSEQASMTLRNIAFWQPDKVVPIIFQKVLDDFGNLTEPHRLFSTLRCAMRVGNAILHDPSLFKGDKSVFVHSLRLALPGLDVNDPAKTSMALNFFIAFLPLVEPSKTGLAELEDIMQEFIDRILFVIENALDMSSLLIVDSSFFSILRKKFPSIFEKIRLQIFRHVTSTFFDAEAAEIPCHLAAFLVTSICETAPEEGLELFMPKLCKASLEIAKDPKVVQQETPEDELFWNLNILCPLVAVGLPFVEKFTDQLIEIIKLALKMRCKKLRDLGCGMLEELLRVMTSAIAKPVKFETDHLVVNVGNVLERDSLLSPLIGWQMPDASSIGKAQRIFDEIVFPALDTLTSLAEDASQAMLKDEIIANVQIVSTAVDGAAEAILPEIVELSDAIRPLESILPSFTLRPKKVRVDEALELVFIGADGKRKNLRAYLKERLHFFLTRFVMINRPDDVQTTSLICATFDALLFNFGKMRGTSENENQIYSNSMQLKMNPISRQWLYTEETLRLRMNVTHGDRLVHDVRLSMSAIDVDIIKTLIELSRSRYTAIGRVSQTVLREAIGIGYSFSWMLFTDEILAPLTSEERKKSDPEGKEFHGALSTVVKMGLVSKLYWSTLHSTWLTLVTCHHDVASELPETQNLLHDLIFVGAFGAETLDLKFTFDSPCVDLAKELWRENSAPYPSTEAPTTEEIDVAKTKKEQRNSKNLALYQDLGRSLTSKIRDDSLRLRSRRGAMDMLSSLFRVEEPISGEITEMALEFLLHPDIETRDWAMEALISILYQLQRKAKKKEMALSELRGNKEGQLGDVQWCLLAKEEDVADFSSETAWKSTNFVDDTFRGYYGWKEPVLVRRYDEDGDDRIEDGGSFDARKRSIENFVFNPVLMEKLMEVLSLDLSGVNQGHANFSEDVVEFWTILCTVLGEKVVSPQSPLVVEAEKLMSAKERSSQGCLAEILSGVVKGSRDWSFASQQRVRDWASKIIVYAVDNILVETKSDWITALIMMTKNRDPRRMRWLLNLLLEKVQSTHGSNSFREANYLSALHGVLISMSWKIPYVLHLVRAQIKPYLNHPYKDIRLPVANILAHVFAFNWKMPGAVNINFPQLKSFIDPEITDLKILNLNLSSTKEVDEVDDLHEDGAEMNDLIERVISLADSTDGSKSEVIVEKMADGAHRRSSLYIHQQVESVLQLALEDASQPTTDLFGSLRRGSSMYDARETDKYKLALVKCKTVMAFLVRFGSINLGGMGSEFISLFPALSSLSGEEKSDEDLKTLLRSSRRSILAARYSTSGLKNMIRMLESCASESLWHSRLVVANSIPIFVTANLFLLHQKTEFVKGIRSIVLKLLIDERLEVRQEAQQTLSSLLHFHFLTVDQKLLRNLMKLAKLGDDASTSISTLSEAHMHKCHGGGSGLCAIVLAFPYDVPKFIPAVLMELSRHVHDPNPIKSSVTSVFSEFRRTHMDNWAEDQLRFTEDQRQALVDVLVSPSYYV